MKDINQVTLRGRVGSAKTFGRENNVLSLSVATTESYQDRGGNWQEVVTWHRVKAFANNRNIPSFDSFEKGMVVYVHGKISTNKYTDKDGNDRETIEIEATDIAIVDTERGANKGQGGNRGRNNDDQDF